MKNIFIIHTLNKYNNIMIYRQINYNNTNIEIISKNHQQYCFRIVFSIILFWSIDENISNSCCSIIIIPSCSLNS